MPYTIDQLKAAVADAYDEHKHRWHIADLREELADAVATIERLDNGCRQARACLLNLQPDEPTPMRAQMQKMVHELCVALGEC